MIYAGIQKNLGPAGMCVGIIKEELLGKALPICPTYLEWKTCIGADSMYNTPACYTWYVMGLYLKYTKKKWLKDAEKVKLFTLAGHRSVGGIRASLYNGMPMEGVACLADFMKAFQQENAK